MRVIKWLWDRPGDVFTARDLYHLIVGALTVIGTVLPPLGFWLATPASPRSLILIALVGGAMAFFAAVRFAPGLPGIASAQSPKPDLRSLPPALPAAPVPTVQVSAPMGKSLPPLPPLPLASSNLPQDKIAPWLLVDTFTVKEASSLWAGEQPGLSFHFDKSKKPAIAAAERLIVTELRNKRDITRASLVVIGDYSEAEVAAADLIGRAKRKRVSPAFLARRSDW